MEFLMALLQPSITYDTYYVRCGGKIIFTKYRQPFLILLGITHLMHKKTIMVTQQLLSVYDGSE